MKNISVIPKPVCVKYTEGEYKSNKIPEPIINKVKNKLSVIKTTDNYTIDDIKTSSIYENPEGYKLIIAPDKIIIEAETAAGEYHARQTLRQLELSKTFPCCEITDYPAFSWRGFMLDSSRYFYSVSFIKKLIDVLSMHHINRFHWHLTDDQGWRLPVKEYPLLTEVGSKRRDHRYQEEHITEGFYTENDIREIVAFASSRQVEVIPEVDLPGHTSAVLASYPELGCTGGPYHVEDRFGIFEDVLCAGNEKIFNLCEKVFDALAELFPSKYVHIGGDEVLFNRWEACPKCQNKLKELGLNKSSELQSRITQKLVQLLRERGKTAIGWDEILDASEKFPLPKEAIVMSWRGTEGGIKASNLGHKVIMTPLTEGCYINFKHTSDIEETGRELGVSTVYQTYNMKAVTKEMKNPHLVLGGGCNLWSETICSGKVAEYMTFPRICALAENLWTPETEKDFNDFAERLKVHRLRLDMLEINQYRGQLK